MNIEKAKEIGFCFGVKRAIDLLEKAAREHGGVETLGALVHNRTVMQALARKGVKVLGGLGEASGRAVAISTHGVGPDVVEEIQARGLVAVDATCPRVRQAQRAARDLANAGFYVVVFGDAAHPEVKGVLGWAQDQGTACVDPAALWPAGAAPSRVGLLSQTTQSQSSFARFAAAIVAGSLPNLREIRVVNTMCAVTRRREAAAVELAKRHDLVVVVGGRSSSNTQRLVEGCVAAGAEAHLVETAAEVEPGWLRGRKSVGVTAGTSTPDEAITEVIERLRELGGQEASDSS